MEKSRQGAYELGLIMNKKQHAETEVVKDDIEILDYPGLRGFLRNITEWSFTLTFWAFWLYLFLPLINLLVWMLVGKTIFSTVIAQSGYLELLEILKKWGIAVVVAIATFTGWAYYNYWMFGRRNRRKRAIACLDEEIASFFHTSPTVINCMKKTKGMEIKVDGPKNPGVIKRLDKSGPQFC